jgi:iron(III) transport system permease protein
MSVNLASAQKTGREAGGLRRSGFLTQKTWLTLLVGVVLAALVIPPLIFLVQGSVTETAPNGAVTGYTLSRFTGLLSQQFFLESARNSFSFALGSSIVALFIGGVNAWLVERTNTPWKPLAYLTTIISLGTPYVLYTGAWLLLLEKSGPINDIYRDLTGSSGLLVDVYGMSGMVFIEGLLWSPLVFLLLGSTLRNFNPELEEAARMSGAGPWQIIWRITLRLALPGILALSLLVFVRTLESFEVPALVGLPGRVHVLITDIYDTMNLTMPPDMGGASALSVLLLVVVAILLFFYGRLTRNAEKFATITGKNFRANYLDLGPWKFVGVGILVLNFILLLVLPTIILIWASLLPFYETFSKAALARVSFVNYQNVFGDSRYVDLLENTLIIAASAATAVMLLSALTAWLTVRKSPGGRILDQLATMPLVFPGIVLGVGVMQLFLYVPVGIYGTIWIIAWAFVINYMPYGVRYSFAGMLQVHRELEEAAAAAGADPFTGFRRVVLPLLTPSMAAGWLFVFLLCTRVLALPVLLSGPSSQTMAVAMFDLWGNGQGPELAALGLLWSFAMSAIAIVFYLIARRSGVGLAGQR